MLYHFQRALQCTTLAPLTVRQPCSGRTALQQLDELELAEAELERGAPRLEPLAVALEPCEGGPQLVPLQREQHRVHLPQCRLHLAAPLTPSGGVDVHQARGLEGALRHQVLVHLRHGVRGPMVRGMVKRGEGKVAW